MVRSDGNGYRRLVVVLTLMLFQVHGCIREGDDCDIISVDGDARIVCGADGVADIDVF